MLEKGTLTAVKGSADGDIPPTLRGPAQALKNAGVTWTTRFAKWYPTLDTESKNATAALLQGGTVEQFTQSVEAAAAKVRADKNIPKHKVE